MHGELTERSSTLFDSSTVNGDLSDWLGTGQEFLENGGIIVNLTAASTAEEVYDRVWQTTDRAVRRGPGQSWQCHSW